MAAWPTTCDELLAVQRELAAAAPPAWVPPDRPRIGGVFVCFPRHTAGEPGERAWAATALRVPGDGTLQAVVRGEVGAGDEPGVLALREGPLLETAVRALAEAPDVLLVNATGRDHPRRAGLALHLGCVLGLPTVGVTDRTLVASAEHPRATRGSSLPLLLDGEVVGFRLRTRPGVRPLVVHAARANVAAG